MQKTPLLLLILLLASCGVADDRVRIKGSFKNIKQAECYIYSAEGVFAGIDTLKIENGDFDYERPLTKPTVLTLLFPNFSELPIIAEPGKEITVKGNAGHLQATEIDGTKENKLLTDFRLDNLKKSKSDVRMAAAQFIRDNAGTQAAIAALKEYFLKAESYDETILGLLDAIRKAQPGNAEVLRLDNYYRGMLVNAVGKPLPDFRAETIDGSEVLTQQLKGKPSLIVCCAGWSNDTPNLFLKLRRLRNAYGEKLGMLILSLDTDKQLISKRLQADTLQSVPTICDGRAFASPLVTLLGVRYVPSILLVNADGRIAARDITVKDLEEKVSSAMK